MSTKKDSASVASRGINVDRYDLLNKIDSPADLRKLPESELPKLVDQIREFLIDVTSKTGGHLAPGLGAVELTIALHYLYDTPEDRIVWDIGHQAYPHKIITGRRELMHTIRKQDGISGFLKREESIYDCFRCWTFQYFHFRGLWNGGWCRSKRRVEAGCSGNRRWSHDCGTPLMKP